MKTLLILLSFISISFSAQSQDIASILESDWEGGSKSITNLTESGYFICTENLYNVNYNRNNNTFTAMLKTTFQLNEAEYSCKVNAKGTFYPSTNKVYIEQKSTIEYDDLPNGLKWVDADLTLYLYNDDDHEGYYYLYGQSSLQYKDDSEEFYFFSNY